VKLGSQNYIVCVISAPDECAKEERVTFEWITKSAKLRGIYIIGLNISDTYEKMLIDIFKTAPGKFINVKSPSDLTPALIKVLSRYCHGLTDEVPTEPSETKSSPETEKKQKSKQD
ncbi:hypothetical protein K8T06_02925, partial [bacterium]|nr:hypothetical protein [bacterium]